MDFEILEVNSIKIAEVKSDEVVINDTQDALDLMANANYYGAQQILIYEHNLNPDFFDLRTKLAGDILQKHVNYQVRLAVVGEFAKFNSKSLDAFIAESNRGSQAFFVSDRETAIAKLTDSK